MAKVVVLYHGLSHMQCIMLHTMGLLLGSGSHLTMIGR